MENNDHHIITLIAILCLCEAGWATPEDEDREIALREYGNDKATDILLDYGYHMLVMPTRKMAA